MTDPSDFHLVLTSAGRPVMHGWWSDGATAERKFSEWIGSHSAIKGAAVVLAERSADGERVLMSWPVEA
ncbi:hypothetical protein [Streptomyces canus]|uniref:hypothetical protein n=1 Tax=Streptomyces canus TaxID=58343 RepID=UPI002E28CA2B|nr:hypothetical protein [Streptomyces canus]